MPVTRPLLSCSPFLSFNPPYAPLDNPVPSVHGSCTTCTSCSQKSHVHHLHTVVLSVLLALLVLLYSVQQPAASLSPPSLSRHCLRCLCVLLRLSWTENSRGRGRISMHPAEPLGRWVFWRCRPHRIFMWETQTYFVSRSRWCRHPYKSTFTLFIFPSC